MKASLLVPVVLVALAILAFAPFFLEGRVLWSQDIGRVYYPAAVLLRRGLATGDFAPLVWNPNIGAGFPLAADGAVTAFYPLHWPILALLPAPAAITAGLFLAYAGAGLAMAAFARTLGTSRAAALVAGVVYGGGGFAMGHAVHANVVAALPFLPLVLLFLEKAARADPARNATLAGLALGLQCLGGHPQVTWMTGLLSLAYAAVRLRPVARAGVVVALFLAIGAGLSAVHYFPLAELAGQSVRATDGFGHTQSIAYSLPSPHLVTALSPFFFFEADGRYWGAWNPAEMSLYAGVVALGLAGLALAGRGHESFVRLFAVVAVLGGLLALGDATPLHGLLHSLPVASSLRAPARYVLLLDFGLAVLAAFGFDAAVRDPRRSVRAAVFVAGAAVLACGLPWLEPWWRGRLTPDQWQDAWSATTGSFWLSLKSLLPPVWLALLALWLWRRPKAAFWWKAAGVALVAADLGSFAMTALGPLWVRPDAVTEPDAVLRLAIGAKNAGRALTVRSAEPWRWASDVAIVHGFPSLTAHVSLPLARYAAFVRAFWRSDMRAHGLLDAAAVGSVVLDASAAAVEPSPFTGEGYSLRREEDGARLYDNLWARPRAFVVHRVLRVVNATEAIHALAGGAARADEAVVIEDPAAPLPEDAGPSTVSIERDEPMRVDLATVMTGSGYVVLADAFYPGWTATIDRRPAPIYAANGLFRAVFVPDGAHHVSLQYEPRALRWGGSVTFATLVGAGLVLARTRRSSPAGNQPRARPEPPVLHRSRP